ncbi:MAG: lytic transglycosylase domain-containing protein [Clostridia bacterium]|nr:lytic transglycosylase domain-containing protein [Clostridia bacterium]
MKKHLIRFIIFVGVVCLAAFYIVNRLFPTTYSEYIDEAAEKYGVDNALIYSMINAESGFKSDAVSDAGAKGLMQITDSTAQWCAKELGYENYDVFNPETNIDLGTFYFKFLLQRYGGDETLAVAAYNAGYGKVDEWLKKESLSADGQTLSQIPYPETDRHIKKINFFRKVYDIILSHSS